MKKNAVAFILMAIGMISCHLNEKHSNGAEHSESSETVRNGVFIHLSKGTEDAHRVLMAFKMAEVMSNDKDVIMYLDIEAVNIVVKDAPDISKEGFASSLEQIKKLTGAGVIIQACPTCLNVAGYSEEDLMEGIILAEKEKFFNFTQGKILTIDY